MANPPGPVPPSWPPGYVSKLSGDKSEQAGQIVVINGVEHQADALGVFDPPLPEAVPDDGAMAEASPHGNPYQAPPAPPPTLLDRAKGLVGGAPPAAPLSPARAALRPGPSAALSPAAMGARLAPVAPETAEDGGRAYVDQVTGERWTVRTFPTADQAGGLVAAGALYRLVGVAAPAVRLVELGDRPAVAWPRLAAWFPIDQVPADVSLELVRELPADVWIGNSRIPDGIKARRYQLAGSAFLVRWDLSGCLAYRAHGRPDGAFTPSDVSGLGQALELEDYARGVTDPGLLSPMAERLAAVTEDQARHALELGGLTPERVAVLAPALLARRSLVALAVTDLVKKGPPRSRR